jgi:hypothetical protein
MSRRALFFLLACCLVSSTHALIKYDSTYLITPGIKKESRVSSVAAQVIIIIA